MEHLSFHHPQTDALAFNVAPDGDWAYLLVGDKLIEWFRRMQGLGVITQYSNALQACNLHLEVCSLLLNPTGRYLPWHELTCVRHLKPALCAHPQVDRSKDNLFFASDQSLSYLT